MKTIILLAMLAFASISHAKTILVMGQSNATGLVKTQALDGEVINCTHRGQPIRKFQLNFTADSYFGQCLRKVQGKAVDALVFWQGESDTQSLAAAEQWGYMASRLINDIRTFAPGLPIIMIALHSGYCYCDNIGTVQEAWYSVRRQQLGFMGVTIVDSSDYEFKPDDVHLTTIGYIDISNKINELVR